MLEDTGESLISLLPGIPCEIDWNKARYADVPVQNLVNALCHPSRAIAFNAARLLYAGMGGEEAPLKVKEILDKGSGHSLQMISVLAAQLWQDKALDHIVDRLERNISYGCNWLFGVLPKLSGFGTDERVSKAILKGLNWEDPKTAAAAAVCLEKFNYNSLQTMKDNLMDALVKWNNEGSLCKKCGIKTTGSSCPECNSVPESPRPSLIKVLASIGVLNLEYLLEYYKVDERSDVITAITEKISEIILNDRDKLMWVINGLNANRIQGQALDAVLMLPDDKLIFAKNELVKLIHCPSALTRFKILKAMSSAKWLSKDKAGRIAEFALNDDEADIRDQAVSTLRTLLNFN